jgi:hypothetical protein
MPARRYGQEISLRYNGYDIHQKIERVIFYGSALKGGENYPKAVGFVNYWGKIFPVYGELKTGFFPEQTDAPLKRGPLSRTWRSG